MTTESFVNSIKLICKSALSGLLKVIEVPPGRSPAQKLVRISNFYNSLGNEDKQIFFDALAISSQQTINNILLVIDGDLAIESTSDKGQLKLYYDDGKSLILLNDSTKIPLSEIFRRQSE